MQLNVIHEAWRAGVKRLLFLGSSCIYPRDCPQPIKPGWRCAGPTTAERDALISRHGYRAYGGRE